MGCWLSHRGLRSLCQHQRMLWPEDPVESTWAPAVVGHQLWLGASCGWGHQLWLGAPAVVGRQLWLGASVVLHSASSLRVSRHQLYSSLEG